MGLTAGRVYECKAEDLAEVPVDVQVKMFQGGRLRAARYDGSNQWHIFDDDEMTAHQEASLRPSLSKETELPSLRLDLGCGLEPRSGFEGVDLYTDEATHKVDLFKFPWPWADSSVGALISNHFLEHVPADYVAEKDILPAEEPHDPILGVEFSEQRRKNLKQYRGQDFLFAVMDECWRILAPGGTFEIGVPNARSDGAFQDPTHRRFWNQHTFRYFNNETRMQMGGGVEKYRTITDFEVLQLTPVGPAEIGLMHPEVQQRKWNTEWNAISEWHAKLRKPAT